MTRLDTIVIASTFVVAMTASQTAAAQAVEPVVDPAPAVTTTTSADSASGTSDTTLGPSAPEPRARETVTVGRSITPNRPWLITGGLLLVGSYIPTAVITATQGRVVEDRNLYIPVAGPWINLADRRCTGCANETGNVAMVIGSGVLQGVGATMTILSFFIPEKIPAATIEAGSARFQIAPAQVGQAGMGLGTVGVF